MGKKFSEKHTQNKPHNDKNSRSSSERKFPKKTESFSKQPRQSGQGEKNHSSNWKPKKDFSVSSRPEKPHTHSGNGKSYHKPEKEKPSNNNNNQTNSWKSKRDPDREKSHGYNETRPEAKRFTPHSNELNNRVVPQKPRKDSFGSNTAGKKHPYSENDRPYHKPEKERDSNNNNNNQTNSWKSKRDPDREKSHGYNETRPESKKFTPHSNEQNNRVVPQNLMNGSFSANTAGKKFTYYENDKPHNKPGKEGNFTQKPANQKNKPEAEKQQNNNHNNKGVASKPKKISTTISQNNKPSNRKGDGELIVLNGLTIPGSFPLPPQKQSPESLADINKDLSEMKSEELAKKTKEEKTKQKRITKKAKKKIKKTDDWLVYELDQIDDDYDDAYSDYENSMEDLYEGKKERIKEEKRDDLESIKDELDEKRSSEKGTLSKWQNLYDRLLAGIQNKHELYGLRRISLHRSRNLKEFIYKKQAYLAYLDKYEEALDYSFENSDYGYVFERFEDSLPENFPYRGKIYYLGKNDFHSKETTTGDNIYVTDLYVYENKWKISAILEKNENSVLNDSISKKLPFMVTYVKTERNNGKLYVNVCLSNACGEIKDSIGNVAGIRATVRGFNKNEATNECFYKLSYKSSKRLLRLSKSDLISERATIPTGSMLRVYVKDSDFALDGTVAVTERTAESLVVDYFDDVIVAMDTTQIKDLKHFLDSHNYSRPTDEWYFHPVGNKITELSQIIIANSTFGLKAEFYETDDGILCLRFMELLTDVSKYGFNSLDMMACTNIEFQVINFNHLMEVPENYADYSRECVKLRAYLIDEFLTQKNATQTDYENGRFIEAWKSITQLLIKETEKEKSGSELSRDKLYKIYTRQNEELQRFLTNKSTNELVKDAILNPGSVKNYNTDYKISFFFNEKINDNLPQQEAVRKALLSQYFYIIQGPPGTGKTTVVREIIQQQLFHNPASRILITSQSDVALDNVLRGLDEFIKINDGITTNQIIRCSGGVGKIAEDILPHSFDEKYQQFKKQYKNEIPDNPLANEIRKDWNALLDSNSNFENLIKEHFLKQFKVIASTCVGLADSHFGLSNIKFDLVIIDEASQILPGDMAIPINRAKKVVLVGDDKQLSSIVDGRLKNGKFDLNGILHDQDPVSFFDQNLFGQIFNKTPLDAKTELKIQYRMPPVLAGLVNIFYDNSLSSGESCYEKQPLIFGNHLFFVDMKDEPDYKSSIIKNKYGKPVIVNYYEAVTVKTIINKVRTKYSTGRIVIIVAFASQVDIIRRELDKSQGNVHVSTVDDFQGNEEDVVIFCMTNTRKNYLFSDNRRLNVAFSRSRNTMIMVGSSQTMEEYNDSQKIKQAFNYIKSEGLVVSYREFVNAHGALNASVST